MSVKKLYYYVKKLSETDKKQSHISLSTNLNIFVNNKSYSVNKVFIEGTRDNFTLYVLIDNVKYYFYGVYYPLTKKHVFYWYVDYKSYYTSLTNTSANPVILVKDEKDPFKFLTVESNNFAHVLTRNNSVMNFLNNNIFYFNDNITKKILNNYFIFNILLFWISIIILIIIIFIVVYFKFIKNVKNVKNKSLPILDTTDDDYEDDE
jgi:hypothetical protein